MEKNNQPNELKFSYNWNNKLNGKAFTTIRLYNPDKYKVNNLYNITLNNEFKGRARLLEIKKIKLNMINSWIALIDTGYDLLDFRAMIKRMYKNKVTDWENQFLHYLLFKYEK